jgi:hypothetical protein
MRAVGRLVSASGVSTWSERVWTMRLDPSTHASHPRCGSRAPVKVWIDGGRAARANTRVPDEPTAWGGVAMSSCIPGCNALGRPSVGAGSWLSFQLLCMISYWVGCDLVGLVDVRYLD